MKIEIEGNRITLSFSLDEKALDLVARVLMKMQEQMPAILADVVSSYKKGPPKGEDIPRGIGELDDIKIE